MSASRRAAAARASSGWNALGLAVFVGDGLPGLLDGLDGVQAGRPRSSARRRRGSRSTRRSRTSPTRSTQPYFWADVKNSLIVVLVTVAISIVLAFLAAVALAKYRFSGRKLFIVLVIGIQMLPQARADHPALRRARPLPPGERAERPDRHLPDLRAAVLDLDAARLHPRHPEGARGGGDGRRSTAARRVREDPAAARGARASSRRRSSRSSRRWNEFIFAHVLLNDQSKQTVTVWLSYFLGTSRDTDWGALMAGVDADRDPGRRSSSCSCSGGSRSG